jgi:hypothetical protein
MYGSHSPLYNSNYYNTVFVIRRQYYLAKYKVIFIQAHFISWSVAVIIPRKAFRAGTASFLPKTCTSWQGMLLLFLLEIQPRGGLDLD